ncbi:unnamed protein product [Ranitomeya imitator]|uniref:LRRC8 pannexin-like TM region domain-containing protein n=1 Tax=Ranitomeya imitator TaxID=111125 RepID=A0ABN9M4X6_9NEOB|nr:unnamed protein product [Ranitomeya imitator]
MLAVRRGNYDVPNIKISLHIYGLIQLSWKLREADLPSTPLVSSSKIKGFASMITVSEAASLADTQAHFKAVKPWWDVLMDYLLIIMLMTSFFSATLLIIMDKVVCMPKSKLAENMSSDFSEATQPTPTFPKDIGHLTNLDYQQYMYVSAVCYHKVMPWQSKYFPYLALINTIMLLVSSNFWFKYPKTSSKVEHFLSILAKCFESPWTTKALEETSDQPPPEHNRQKSSSSRSIDYSPRTPLIHEMPLSFVPISVSAILDKKEGEQAKALFEKIRHFRAHVEDSDVVYRVYVGQTVFKVVKVAIILGEGRVREIALNSEWPAEKLRQMIYKDSNGRFELQLAMIPVIPRDVYELSEIQILKLELISSAKFVGAVSQLKSLLELHISHCSVKMDPEAFSFIRERLKVLHVRFTDMEELPSWMYSLKNLSQLHLSGNLNCSNNRSIRLQSLYEDCLDLMLDVAGQLSEFSLQNGDTEFGSLGQLKRMNQLLLLKLCHCKMTKIPGAVFGLTSLQCIDLTFNCLQYVEELGTLHRLRSLTILRLSHNAISHLPPSIELLRNLEELSISNNKLENLPVSLFNLVRLRHLDVSYNHIRLIPHEVGHLTRLESLTINCNQISLLPRELFRCTRLRSLHVSSNKLTTLPPEIGQLPLLTSLDLMGNNLTELPEEIANCLQLKKGGIDVEEHVLGRLAPELRKKFM